MSIPGLKDFLVKIAEFIPENRISRSDDILHLYSHDQSLVTPQVPAAVIWPTNPQEVQQIVAVANENAVPLVPVSSGPGKSVQGGNYRQNGDTIPRQKEAIIVDLSKMNSIFRVDRVNRVCLVEPGVTFSQLIPELEKQDLRPLMPLCPRSDKSVLASALEREPQLIPRYHWDAADPLLCTEIIFGTGDLFRTGAAAGPGSLEEQWATGQSQKNPMGPTQFSIYRTVQGAMGSMGIVTWASLKCELLPSIRKILYLLPTGGELQPLLDALHELVKYRIGDEVFLLNTSAFSALWPDAHPAELEGWVGVVALSGRGKFADEKIAYWEGDLREYLAAIPIDIRESLTGLENARVLDTLSGSTDKPWAMNPRGASRNIFFISPLDKCPEFVEFIQKEISNKYPVLDGFGVYIQPQIQGCNLHLEFQLYFDPDKSEEVNAAKAAFLDLSDALIRKGAFYSRPYGPWAQSTFAALTPEIPNTLRRVKQIFDPGNILHPGILGIDSSSTLNPMSDSKSLNTSREDSK